MKAVALLFVLLCTIVVCSPKRQYELESEQPFKKIKVDDAYHPVMPTPSLTAKHFFESLASKIDILLDDPPTTNMPANSLIEKIYIDSCDIISSVPKSLWMAFYGFHDVSDDIWLQLAAHATPVTLLKLLMNPYLGPLFPWDRIHLHPLKDDFINLFTIYLTFIKENFGIFFSFRFRIGTTYIADPSSLGQYYSLKFTLIWDKFNLSPFSSTEISEDQISQIRECLLCCLSSPEERAVVMYLVLNRINIRNHMLENEPIIYQRLYGGFYTLAEHILSYTTTLSAVESINVFDKLLNALRGTTSLLEAVLEIISDPWFVDDLYSYPFIRKIVYLTKTSKVNANVLQPNHSLIFKFLSPRIEESRNIKDISFIIKVAPSDFFSVNRLPNLSLENLQAIRLDQLKKALPSVIATWNWDSLNEECRKYISTESTVLNGLLVLPSFVVPILPSSNWAVVKEEAFQNLLNYGDAFIPFALHLNRDTLTEIQKKMLQAFWENNPSYKEVLVTITDPNLLLPSWRRNLADFKKYFIISSNEEIMDDVFLPTEYTLMNVEKIYQFEQNFNEIPRIIWLSFFGFIEVSDEEWLRLCRPLPLSLIARLLVDPVLGPIIPWQRLFLWEDFTASFNFIISSLYSQLLKMKSSIVKNRSDILLRRLVYCCLASNRPNSITDSLFRPVFCVFPDGKFQLRSKSLLPEEKIKQLILCKLKDPHLLLVPLEMYLRLKRRNQIIKKGLPVIFAECGHGLSLLWELIYSISYRVNPLSKIRSYSMLVYSEVEDVLWTAFWDFTYLPTAVSIFRTLKTCKPSRKYETPEDFFTRISNLYLSRLKPIHMPKIPFSMYFLPLFQEARITFPDLNLNQDISKYIHRLNDYFFKDNAVFSMHMRNIWSLRLEQLINYDEKALRLIKWEHLKRENLQYILSNSKLLRELISPKGVPFQPDPVSFPDYNWHLLDEASFTGLLPETTQDLVTTIIEQGKNLSENVLEIFKRHIVNNPKLIRGYLRSSKDPSKLEMFNWEMVENELEFALVVKNQKDNKSSTNKSLPSSKWNSFVLLMLEGNDHKISNQFLQRIRKGVCDEGDTDLSKLKAVLAFRWSRPILTSEEWSLLSTRFESVFAVHSKQWKNIKRISVFGENLRFAFDDLTGSEQGIAADIIIQTTFLDNKSYLEKNLVSVKKIVDDKVWRAYPDDYFKTFLKLALTSLAGQNLIFSRPAMDSNTRSMIDEFLLSHKGALAIAVKYNHSHLSSLFWAKFTDFTKFANLFNFSSVSLDIEFLTKGEFILLSRIPLIHHKFNTKQKAVIAKKITPKAAILCLAVSKKFIIPKTWHDTVAGHYAKEMKEEVLKFSTLDSITLSSLINEATTFLELLRKAGRASYVDNLTHHLTMLNLRARMIETHKSF